MFDVRISLPPYPHSPGSEIAATDIRETIPVDKAGVPSCIAKDGFACMIATSKVTNKHQTTRPKVVVNALHLKAGSRLVYEMSKEGIHLYARTGTLQDLLEDEALVPSSERPEIHSCQPARASEPPCCCKNELDLVPKGRSS